jgi:hypothetical protein
MFNLRIVIDIKAERARPAQVHINALTTASPISFVPTLVQPCS